ncbi:hypothetical protein [Hyphomonas adhaerens]|uniref:hypothetical protein n=1 Tax=Hyphomonas adhaerens TaxID=81029 RepID=UPI002352A9B3|nr:hypothetical protein [Hyphomonas adhaerens]|tara:strand:+ start:1167 stop:1325 length:159 start_codon:yes stop_codon:yes gene_type:complete
MNFDLTAHTARQNRKTAADTIKEACRLIAGCTDPQRRFLAMIELRRMQAMAF